MLPIRVPENQRNLPTSQLKEFVSQNILGGSYAIKICRKCGTVYCDLEGQCNTAKIVTVCKTCFED